MAGTHYCENGGDDILVLKGTMVKGFLFDVLAPLGDFYLLQEVGIQTYVSCGNDGGFWIPCV